MTLQIRFPKQAPTTSMRRKRQANDIGNRLLNLPLYQSPNLTLKAWKDQEPRMSSARIMMEVRRRLWIEVCSESTGFYDTEKLLKWITALNKRIAARVVEPELTPKQISILNDLFNNTMAENKKRQGFAVMTPEQRREIASKGGKSHSQAHMAEIGRRGGMAPRRKDQQQDA